jgi:carbamate kinase
MKRTTASAVLLTSALCSSNTWRDKTHLVVSEVADSGLPRYVAAPRIFPGCTGNSIPHRSEAGEFVINTGMGCIPVLTESACVSRGFFNL